MSGFLTRVALALEPFSTSPLWPATAAEEVTVLLPLLSENVRDLPVARATFRRHPRSGPPSRTLRAVTVEGPLTLDCTYNDLSAVWAWALGLQHSQYPEELVFGAYSHLYEIDPVLHSHPWPFGAFLAGDIQFNQQLVRRATLAIERTTSVWEHLSVMVRSLTVNASPDGVTLSLNLVGHSTDRASAINTTGIIAALSEPAWQWVQFHQLEARIGPFSASTALDSSDAISIQNFRLEVSNHLKTRQRRDSGLYMGEPRRDRHAEVSGSFTLAYYESDAFIDWALAQTLLMAELRFTGPDIEETPSAHQLCFWLPAFQLEAPDAGTPGPEDREPSFNFRAVVSETDPAGFPTFALSGPLYVELLAPDSVNPLTGEDHATAPPEPPGVTDGLVMWFRAEDLAGTHTDGQTVDNWTDSVSAVTISRTSGAPVFKTAILNGYPVVRVTQDRMNATGPVTGPVTGATFFVVTTNVSSVATGGLFHIQSGTFGGPYFYYTSGLSGIPTFITKDNTTFRRGATSLIPGPNVSTAVYDGAGGTTDVYYNGVLDNGTLTGAVPASVTIGSQGTGMGKGTHLPLADIAEVLYYDRALSSLEREVVEAYLMEKYAIS